MSDERKAPRIVVPGSARTPLSIRLSDDWVATFEEPVRRSRFRRLLDRLTLR